MSAPLSRDNARALMVRAVLFLFSLGMVGCASTDHRWMREARRDYLEGRPEVAETRLLSKEASRSPEDRLRQFLYLGQIAFAEGLYEKALVFLNLARDLARELRSDRGGFEWLSKDYKSNSIEYSYLHFLLVVSNLSLSQSKSVPQWRLPEVKRADGSVLIPAQEFSARVLQAREAAEFRTRARAELLAWNQYLELLKKTYGGSPFYQEDVLARALGGFVHGSSESASERRIGELLIDHALRAFPTVSSGVSAYESEREGLENLLREIRESGVRMPPKEGPGQLFLVPSGLIPEYRMKRVVLGVSLLFRQIEDPLLRRQLEELGFRVLIHYAPEFGLMALAGSVVGAATSTAEEEESPRYLTDALDRGLGFEMRFPMMVPGPNPGSRMLMLGSLGGSGQSFQIPILPVFPTQQILSKELRERREREWMKKALSIGLEYLAILIPAVKAYQAADRDQNLFRKLAILGGYMMAKKAIDASHDPDLRSWALIPSEIGAGIGRVPPGDYRATFEGRDLGVFSVPEAAGAVILSPHLINPRPSVRLTGAKEGEIP